MKRSPLAWKGFRLELGFSFQVKFRVRISVKVTVEFRVGARVRVDQG